MPRNIFCLLFQVLRLMKEMLTSSVLAYMDSVTTYPIFFIKSIYSLVKKKHKGLLVAASFLYAGFWYPEWSLDCNTDAMVIFLVLAGSALESFLKKYHNKDGSRVLQRLSTRAKFKHIGPGKYSFYSSYLNYLVVSASYAANPAFLMARAFATLLSSLLCMSFCAMSVAQLVATFSAAIFYPQWLSLEGGGPLLLQSFTLPNDLWWFMEPQGGLTLPWLCGLMGFILAFGATSTFFNFSPRLLLKPAMLGGVLFWGLMLLNSLKSSCFQWASFNIAAPNIFFICGDAISALVYFGLGYYYYSQVSKGPLGVFFSLTRFRFPAKAPSSLIKSLVLATLFVGTLVFLFLLINVCASLHCLVE